MTPGIAFTAPHHAVSRIGLDLLAAGCSAVDAMIAASAAIGVAYPHMNSLGGDGFWLISRPGQEPVAIDACGFAAAAATPAWYGAAFQSADGKAAIPGRGPGAALCQAGALDGWRLARELDADHGGQSAPLSRLLAPAIALAENGFTVTASLQAASRKLHREGVGNDSFKTLFTPGGEALREGEKLANPDLARFLLRLVEEGTESFYRGPLADDIAAALADLGSPLARNDFTAYRAEQVQALSVELAEATLFNLPPPTQGVASLLILAIQDRLRRVDVAAAEAEWVHLLVEATKQAFMVRDREVCDPRRLSSKWHGLLTDQSIDSLASAISRDRALEWPRVAAPGDTVWMGAVDAEGTMVSYIQSVYWEFGAGVVIPGLGLVWNNRGLSFRLDPSHRNCLRPRHKPLHTLNPAYAEFSDGRRLVYGTMGGEGQPQTQAALFSRYAHRGLSLAEAIAAPRWLLGRTWGDSENDLKLEASLFAQIGEELAGRGHRVQAVPDRAEMMGHAGAILVCPDGRVEAATDPRSDGAAPVGAAPVGETPAGAAPLSDEGL